MDDFKECAECAKKPGTPPLCPSCLHNRELISRLKILEGKCNCPWQNFEDCRACTKRE